MIVVFGIQIPLMGGSVTHDQYQAFAEEGCAGDGHVYDSVSDMLRGIEDNGWKSFKLETYSVDGINVTWHGGDVCTELTPDIIKSLETLKVAEKSMEEMLVVGKRLDTGHDPYFANTTDQLNASRGEIPEYLLEHFFQLIEQAMEAFKKAMLDCLFSDFPVLKEVKDEVKIKLGNLLNERAMGLRDGSTLTIDLNIITHSATIARVDLYTLTQNVLFHEIEHYRERLNEDLHFYDGDEHKWKLLEFTEERFVQVKTFNTWYDIVDSPPPLGFYKKSTFDKALKKYIKKQKKKLKDSGVDVSTMSNKQIEAQYIEELKELMEDDGVDIKRNPLNNGRDAANGSSQTYNNDEHAVEPCEKFESDE